MLKIFWKNEERFKNLPKKRIQFMPYISGLFIDISAKWRIFRII